MTVISENTFMNFIFSGRDSEISAILVLVHLLPPSPHGCKRPGKLSARDASDHLVKFIKVRLQLNAIWKIWLPQVARR